MRLGGKQEPYCLVLSGGGAKGVYHIGAWRALKELRVPVDAFIGNSIGAIIAAFLAQGADQELEDIGRTIDLDTIVNLPEGFKERGRLKLDAAKMPSLKDLYREFAQKKGIDTAPMRSLLEKRLDEALIRNSGSDLGIVTVNVTDLKPREVFIEDMEDGRIVDYLMASSAIPGFTPPEIDGKKYVDGGLWDNIPYAMARKRGYTRIIVLDISGLGVNRRPDIAGSETVYIRNSIDMGGVLDFDRAFLDKFTELGYLDTMRAFGRFKGYSYFVKANPGLERRFSRFLADNPLPAGTDPVSYPEAMRYDRNLLLKHLECAALILGVERVRPYTYRSLAEAIDERLRVEGARLSQIACGAGGRGQTSAERGRGLEILIRESLKRRMFEECPYYVLNLVRSTLSGRTRTFLESALCAFWPSIEAGFSYLDLKDSFWRRL